MATTKNQSDNKGTEQRGHQPGLGKAGEKPDHSNQPGDRSAQDKMRSGGLPGTQRRGAETTPADASDRSVGNHTAPNKTTGGERTDSEVASDRTMGQESLSTRGSKDRELLDEDDADRTGNPASDELDEDLTVDVDVDTDEDMEDRDAPSGRV